MHINTSVQVVDFEWNICDTNVRRFAREQSEAADTTRPAGLGHSEAFWLSPTL